MRGIVVDGRRLRARCRMTLCAAAGLSLATLGTAWGQARRAGAPPKPNIQLSPNVPFDVTLGTDRSLNTLQADFDIFSWNSFIALNWPAKPDGSPDLARKPGAGVTGDNDTVWEHWIDSSSITVAPGQVPSFTAPQEVPAACASLAAPGMRVLGQDGKTPTQPFNTGPLIDQSKAYARFEIRVNQDMFKYILDNNLYSKAGQQQFAGTVKFPCGAAGKHVGAVMVKAAWKILGAQDDSSHFHTTKALVFTPDPTGGSAGMCGAQKVGLVGLHVAHKTATAPQWAWSTFEHVENAPTDVEVKSGPLKSRYNFFDPKCKDCAVNAAAERSWNPAAQDRPPTQVVRRNVITPDAQASAAAQNNAAQGLFAKVNSKSVWRFYELISTQWPTDPGNAATCTANPANPAGTPEPPFLANATLETFVQGKSEGVSSSCILCHNNAAMAVGGSRGASDFTYILQLAQ
jgi:hypothetical protein